MSSKLCFMFRFTTDLCKYCLLPLIAKTSCCCLEVAVTMSGVKGQDTGVVYVTKVPNDCKTTLIKRSGGGSEVREGRAAAAAAAALTLWMCETWLKDRSSQDSSDGSDRKWLMGRKRSCSSLMLLLLSRSERLLYFLSASRLRGRKPRVGSIFHDSDHTHTAGQVSFHHTVLQWKNKMENKLMSCLCKKKWQILRFSRDKRSLRYVAWQHQCCYQH